MLLGVEMTTWTRQLHHTRASKQTHNIDILVVHNVLNGSHDLDAVAADGLGLARVGALEDRVEHKLVGQRRDERVVERLQREAGAEDRDAEGCHGEC